MNDSEDRNVPALRPVTPVGIVTDKLRRLVGMAEKISDLDRAFLALLAEAHALAAGLDDYVAGCTTPESTALAALVADTASNDWSMLHADGKTRVPLEREMVSGHVEGQFLKMLVHATAARRVLEVGLFTGYSALAMAEALPLDGILVACELDPLAAGVARGAFDRSPHGAKIRIEVGDAGETLERLRTEADAFDLIFIDADKGGYGRYLEHALLGLLAPNGLICVDNTLLQGEPYLSGKMTPNGAAIAQFNAAVAADPRVEQVLLPLRDGLTLIRRA